MTEEKGSVLIPILYRQQALAVALVSSPVIFGAESLP